VPVVEPILVDFAQGRSHAVAVKVARWLANVVEERLTAALLPFQCHSVEIAFDGAH
jgi:hypothetical protein